MFIVAGSKRSEKFVGYGAGFCSFCRTLRAVKIEAHEMKLHLYYIPYKSDSPVWYMQECINCGAKSVTEISSYKGLVQVAPSSLKELIHQTYPDIENDYAERLEIEKQVNKDPMSLDEELRHKLIKEPISKIAPQVEEGFSAGTPLDLQLGITFLIAVAVSVPSLLFALSIEDYVLQHRLTSIAWLIIIICVIVVIFTWVRTSMRICKRRYLPLVVRALLPLKPSTDELKKMAKFYKVTKMKVGKRWFQKLLRKELGQSLKKEHQTIMSGDVSKGDYIKAMNQWKQ